MANHGDVPHSVATVASPETVLSANPNHSLAGSDPTEAASRIEVFISYSSQDRPKALAVAKAVAARGWTVWIDQWRLLGGTPFRQQIQNAVEQAKTVLVLWSVSSTHRDWVKAEAETGRQRQALVSARLDDTPVPIPFTEYQIRDLRRWDGQDSQHEELLALMRDVAHVLKQEVPAELVANPTVSVMRPVRALAPLALAAALLVTILSWLVFRLGVPTPVAFGAPIFVTVFAFLVRTARAEAWLGRGVAMVCGRWGLACLAVVTLTLGCFSSVVIEAPSPFNHSLAVRLTPGEDSAVVLRATRLSAEQRRVRWLLATSPAGRTVRATVEGHDPRAVRLYPWRGVTLRLREELKEHPVMLVRVHRDKLALIDQAELRVEREGLVLAQIVLSNRANAMLIGGQAPLDDQVAGWRESLRGWRGPVSNVCEGWKHPVSTDWERPPGLDDKVRVSLQPRGNQLWRSEPFPLTGAFTDAEPTLQLVKP